MGIIVSPINSIDELYQLHNEGAREFYFGYLSKQWVDEYGAFTGNRRENFEANFTDLNNIKELLIKIKELGINCAITFNDRYTYQQYDMLKKMLHEVIEAGANRIIVADVGLIVQINNWRLPLEMKISTGGGVFNHQTVNFYKEMGIKRIIFPRQLTISEINQIVKSDSSLEYEIFGMYGRDPYIDAFCRFHHGMNCIIPRLGPCGCMRLNNADIRNLQSNHVFKPYNCLNTLHVDGCCACGIKSLNMGAIKYYKIVGRAAKTERKVQAIAFMKRVLDNIESGNINNFQRYNKELFNEIYGEPCTTENCYYRVEDSLNEWN